MVASHRLLSHFLEEFMKKFFNEFCVGKVDKSKPARPTMVGIQGKFLGMLCINLMSIMPCQGIYILNLHLLHTWYICFREEWKKTLSSRLSPQHSMQKPVPNQTLISVVWKDLIAKVDCSSLWDHRCKLKEMWGHLWPNLILKFQRKDSVLMTVFTCFLLCIKIPRHSTTSCRDHLLCAEIKLPFSS